MTRAVVIAIAAGPVLAGCLAPADFKGKKNPDFHVIGHRGAPRVEAENTVAAMEAAARLGANAVEVDLVVTADDEVVLWHDRDPDRAVALARQSGVEGLAYVPVVPEEGSPLRRPVDELVLADFLASHGYASSAGDPPDPEAPIALLADFLGWLRSEPRMRAVYFDVKVDDPEEAAVIVDRLHAARSGGLGSVRFYLMSTVRTVIEAVVAEVERRDASGLRPVWDFESDGALEGAERLGLADVSTGLTPTRSESAFLDEVEDLLAARKDKRIDSVVVWTIDRRMQLGVLLYYGVDGIMTNDPRLLRNLWDKTL